MTNKWEVMDNYTQWRYEQELRAAKRRENARWLDDLKGKVYGYSTDELEQDVAAYTSMRKEEMSKPYSEDKHDAMWFYSMVIEICQKELNRRKGEKA